MGRVCCHYAQEHMQNRKWNPKDVRPRDFEYCLRKPDCIVTTNLDRLVLIPTITWHFSFQPVNVRIVNLKGEYDIGSESRFTCPSHCYIMWCPLTTGIVASQFPSSRDTVLVTCFLKPLASAFLNAVKQFYHHQTFSNEFAILIDNCGVAFDTNDQWNHSKASDWPRDYGDMCLPSLHMRLLATRHM